jgi:hypothetical protein
MEIYTGALEVMLDAPGARVLVDGAPRGTTPLEVLDDVPVGTHALQVQLDGVAPFTHDVVVKVGERTRVALAVKDGALVEVDAAATAAATPPSSSGMHVSVPLAAVGGGALALGVVGIVVGGVAWVVAEDAYTRANAAPDEDVPALADANAAWAATSTAAFVVGAIAGAAGAAVLATSFFVDPFGE